MSPIPREAALGFEKGASERGLIGDDGLLDTPYRTHVVWCRRREA